MKYTLIVDPSVQEEINGPFYIPGPVKVGLAECLAELESNPHLGVLTDPVFGLCKVHQQEYGSILWRCLFFFDRYDESGIIYVKKWIVESEGR